MYSLILHLKGFSWKLFAFSGAGFVRFAEISGLNFEKWKKLPIFVIRKP